MALSHLRRTATAAAVVTATAAFVVPTLYAGPASATGRASTSLSIRAVHPAVKPGNSDTLTGALGVAGAGTAAGRTVTLEARPLGATSFTPVGDAVAREHGGISETVTPDVTTRYRWHYAGDTDARPSTSGVATVRVRTPQHPAQRIPTSLSIRAVHRVAKRDGVDVVRGRLRAERVSLPHRRVILVSRTADATSWTFEGVHRTRHLGVVAFKVEPAADTAYRLVFLGTPLLQPAHSAVVRVVSRPDVTIAATPKRINPGDTATVSGTVTDDGTPVAGATVRLLARKAGSKHGGHLVGTGTTAADGSVSFTDNPTVSTVYRLHLLHAAGQPGAVSHATRVWVRRPTSLSIRGKDTATEFVVSGNLRGGGHPLGHRTVTLLEQAPGSTTWTAAGTDKTGPHGVVQFHEPQAPGTGYRLAYAGGPRFAPSSSGTVVS
jgi:hypothetical protein